MVFKIEHNAYLIGMLRRKWRKDGRYTVRVTRGGTVCVMRMPLHEDMKTEAQMRCRVRFTKAQEMMLEALKDKKLRRYFQKRRLRKGYKTLRGCIRAYYIEELLFQEQRASRDMLGVKMKKALADVVCNADVELSSTEDNVSADSVGSAHSVDEEVSAVVRKDVECQGSAECDIGDG